MMQEQDLTFPEYYLHKYKKEEKIDPLVNQYLQQKLNDVSLIFSKKPDKLTNFFQTSINDLRKAFDNKSPEFADSIVEYYLMSMTIKLIERYQTDRSFLTKTIE